MKRFFMDLDHQFEDEPHLRRDHLRDLMVPKFLLNLNPSPATSPRTSPIRYANEASVASGATSSGGGAAAGAPPSSASGGAAGIGNLLPWLYPTADFINLDKFGAVPLPAISSIWTLILKFTVPRGRNGKITQLGIDVSTTLAGDAPFIQAVVPPQLAFQISTDQKNYPFQDYESFNFAPGSVSAPTPINGLMIKENQTVLVRMQNLALAVGSQFVAARLLGYLYSKNLEPEVLGYQ